MPVGKARAAAVEAASDEFRLVVPSFTTIDRAAINDHLQRDQFFWLDLAAPAANSSLSCEELFAFTLSRWRDSRALPSAAQARQLRRLCISRLLRRLAHSARCDPAPLREVHMFSRQLPHHDSPRPAAALDDQREQLQGRCCTASSSCSSASSRLPTASSAAPDIDDEIDELEAQVLANPNERQLTDCTRSGASSSLCARSSPPTRPVRQLGRPDRRASWVRARRARLLPRNLRPPHPHQRTDRLLPRPPVRRDGPLPIDRQQPPERRDEATHGDRHHLPAAVVHHRLLWTRTSGTSINHLIAREWTFWVVGVGSMLATCAGLLVFFRRKGWV